MKASINTVSAKSVASKVDPLYLQCILIPFPLFHWTLVSPFRRSVAAGALWMTHISLRSGY
jgi:hypothetical protein